MSYQIECKSRVDEATLTRSTESESHLRSILDSFEDVVWLINHQLELIDFNRKFYDLYFSAFGVRLVKGKNIIDMIPAKHSGLGELWKDRYQKGLTGSDEKYIDNYELGGQLKTFEITMYPIWKSQKITGLTLYSRNITQQKEAELKLMAQNEELIKVNEELDRFVYSASHDLRAPLMSMKGLLNMIKLDPEKTEEYYSLIGKSISRMYRFISDIIQYSQNSRMEIIATKIDFHYLMNECIESLKYIGGSEEVESIREFFIEHDFYADYGRLLIVFNNIVGNAVKYRKRFEKGAFIKVKITTAQDAVTINFVDNGVGISEKYLNQVFKMFFRANSDSKGSGLGLYIVKNAIAKLNGTIEITSSLGHGTSFQIVLPNQKPLGT